LQSRKVRSATDLAAKGVTAADSQHTTLPGEGLVADIAKAVMSLDEQLKHIDKLIEGRFPRHRSAEVLLSMPGIGLLLGAEFLAATGGDMAAFTSADHLAGYAGLAPRHATPAGSVATRTAHVATTAGSNEPCTPPHWSASAATTGPESSTTAREPRENATPKPSSRWHAAASMLSGPARQSLLRTGAAAHRGRRTFSS
jgi:hypothetical protein